MITNCSCHALSRLLYPESAQISERGDNYFQVENSSLCNLPFKSLGSGKLQEPGALLWFLTLGP